jgi:hypothetical protein
LAGAPSSGGLAEEWRTGLAAAQGSIAVPVRDYLHVLGSALAPASDGVGIVVEQPFLVTGQRALLSAAVGRNLRSNPPKVRLEFDRYPYGGWRRASEKTPRAEGVADFTYRPTRNTRFRAVNAANAKSVSEAVTAYAYPRINTSFREVGYKRGRINFSVRGPSDIRLGGRRIFLYLNRAGSSRLTRLAGATLSTTGRGRAKASAVFLRPKRIGDKDLTYFCIRAIESQGFGYRDRLAKTCGARRATL